MSNVAAIQATEVEYRHAQVSDRKAILLVEEACFANDRLSERQILYWLRAVHKVMYVALLEGQIVGYGLAIMRKGTSLARLYSLAVLSTARGLGIGKHLLGHLEQSCVEKNKLFLRLEVAISNHSAIALYSSLGYKEFGFYSEYYEDHSDALRMQKAILHNSIVNSDVHINNHSADVTALRNVKSISRYPYFQQTTEFTCGPAALLMAMAKLNQDITLSQQAELEIWRSATTIFMSTGHGGTHPLGLALAAVEYGFKPEVFINQHIPLFLASVRNEQKKSVLAFVEERFLRQATQANIAIRYEDFSSQHLNDALKSGASVICLISSYQFDGFKGPHWVSVTHIDEHFLYIHDPEAKEQVIERQHVPVSLEKFERYTRYGKAGLRTAIILRE